MLKKIESLNDLSITIHGINKHYHIGDFVDECKREMGSLSDLLMAGLTDQNGFHNPVRRILELSKVMPDDDLEKMIAVCERLNSKYSFDRYLQECETARSSFLKERSNYFSAKVLTKPERREETLNIFDLSNTSDYLLADWIDKVLRRINPKSVNIVYEDMTGRIVKTKIRHHPEVTFHKDGSVESRLIDRHHGLNAYDSFLLHSFYSSTEGKWMLVPIRLIISLDCDQEFDLMLDEESKKARGEDKKGIEEDDDNDLGGDSKQTDDPEYY